MKWPNIWIIRVVEWEGILVTDRENIFNKITEGKFPNLKKEMYIKAEGA